MGLNNIIKMTVTGSSPLNIYAPNILQTDLTNQSLKITGARSIWMRLGVVVSDNTVQLYSGYDSRVQFAYTKNQKLAFNPYPEDNFIGQAREDKYEIQLKDFAFWKNYVLTQTQMQSLYFKWMNNNIQVDKLTLYYRMSQYSSNYRIYDYVNPFFQSRRFNGSYGADINVQDQMLSLYLDNMRKTFYQEYTDLNTRSYAVYNLEISDTIILPTIPKQRKRVESFTFETWYLFRTLPTQMISLISNCDQISETGCENFAINLQIGSSIQSTYLDLCGQRFQSPYEPGIAVNTWSQMRTPNDLFYVYKTPIESFNPPYLVSYWKFYLDQRQLSLLYDYAINTRGQYPVKNTNTFWQISTQASLCDNAASFIHSCVSEQAMKENLLQFKYKESMGIDFAYTGELSVAYEFWAYMEFNFTQSLLILESNSSITGLAGINGTINNQFVFFEGIDENKTNTSVDIKTQGEWIHLTLYIHDQDLDVDGNPITKTVVYVNREQIYSWQNFYQVKDLQLVSNKSSYCGYLKELRTYSFPSDASSSVLYLIFKNYRSVISYPLIYPYLEIYITFQDLSTYEFISNNQKIYNDFMTKDISGRISKNISYQINFERQNMSSNIYQSKLIMCRNAGYWDGLSC
ncbi:UNKNOWN [Stylonychia lemnae]|uniref:Uncharacterized protein n=1 Tax=Stylonychia lemnae TaxID=5949 RepID=A0A078AV60_STYLE|nr:UNKNOWN [Stylonychia lemnae]|eukprot:CDW85152.1 UNKNOWN [Stylonychia lemnae]